MTSSVLLHGTFSVLEEARHITKNVTQDRNLFGFARIYR